MYAVLLINGEIERFADFVLPMQVAVQGNNVKYENFYGSKGCNLHALSFLTT